MESVTRKTLLYKTSVEYGDFTINHVEGCFHGCLFPCYAFNLAKRFGKVRTYEEWIKPKIVSNAMALLEREIPKYKREIKSVHLCFTTDPFMMGHPEVTELSIEIIRKLNAEGIKVTTLTKGLIPLEVMQTSKQNEFGITLVSLDEQFRERFEPNTANYEERIQRLKCLHDAGFPTWVSIEPYPTPNIIEQDLALILERVAFVDFIVFGRWHYNKTVSSYADCDQFFNRCADFVESFCQERRIRCHIKEKTRTQ